jgi:O-antigen ligase
MWWISFLMIGQRCDFEIKENINFNVSNFPTNYAVILINEGCKDFMIIKKDYKKNLPLILLAIAIALSPSFSAGMIEGGRVIEIRVEDILIVILGLFWIANFLISKRGKIKKPPLLLPILAWLSIGFFSILINMIFMNIEISRGLFYFLKEVEFFFLFFYVFYHIKNIDSVKCILDFWIILGMLNVCLIIFQLLSGIGYGAYGPSMFMERGPLPSGGSFLILFANLFNIFLYYYFHSNLSKIKKMALALCIFSLSIGVISSGSRTAILGLIVVIILSLFFYQFKCGMIKSVLITLGMMVIIGVMFYFISDKVPYILNLRPERALKSINGRSGIWIAQLEAMPEKTFYYLFGMGKSVWVRLSAEESHSQYVRNFIETGIVGSLIFFFLIFVIIKKSFREFLSSKESLLTGLSSGLLVSTIAMLFISIVAEGFLVVKINEIYWFFTAISMAAMSFNEREIVQRE